MDFRFFISRITNAPFAENIYRIRKVPLVTRLGVSASFGCLPLPVAAVDSRCLADLQMPTFDVQVSVDAIEGLLRGKPWSQHAGGGSLASFEERMRRVFFSRILTKGRQACELILDVLLWRPIAAAALGRWLS